MIYDNDSNKVIFQLSYCMESVPVMCMTHIHTQMALQLAYYRLHQRLVLTYESATTRLYYQGRTGTIRPVSEHSVAFVKSFDDPSVPREEVKKALRKAIE